MSILIVIFAISFLIISFYKLDWALLILIALLPSYLIRFHVFGIPSTLLELMILTSTGIWMLKEFIPSLKKYSFKERHPYPFSKEIIAIVIISFIAVAISGFSNSALGLWKAYFFEPILLFILIINTFQKKEDWKKILLAFLTSTIIISLPAIYQQITGHYIFNSFWAQEPHRRVVSWFGYPNAIGLYLAPITMLLIAWLFNKDSKSLSYKLIIIISIILSIASIYFAQSDGALIGLIAGLIIFGLLGNKKSKLLTIGIFLLALSMVFAFPSFKNKVYQKVAFQSLSGRIREQQWKETWKMLSDGRIITGAGLGNYQKITKPYHQAGIFYNRDHIKNFDSVLYGNAELRKKYWQPTELYLYPHNIFLNFWSELGLLGLIAFIWIIIKYFIILFKIKKENHSHIIDGLIAAMVVIVIHGLVDVPYFKNDLSMMFWILLSLVSLFKLQTYEYNITKSHRL